MTSGCCTGDVFADFDGIILPVGLGRALVAERLLPTQEEFVYAIADALHDEYQTIVDAGFVLQLDDPDLADAWQIYPDSTVGEYRKFAERRLDALNQALRGLPVDRVRFHMCWGSYHGPTSTTSRSATSWT